MKSKNLRSIQNWRVLGLLLVLLATVTIGNSQTKKMVPSINKLTLSATKTKNVETVNSKGCPATAVLSANGKWFFPGQTVTFINVSVSNNNQIFAKVITNAKGEANITIPWNTSIRAEYYKLKSADFACGEQISTK